MITLDTERVRSAEAAKCVYLLDQAATPLPPPLAADFGEFFDRFGGARVVLLGEATHGTAEFYQARAAITRRLIERHGFNIVAVEADWPDGARIDAFVRLRQASLPKEPAFARFPSWMWRNTDMRDFVHWLRDHNSQLAAAKRVEFRGLDIYSLENSIVAVLNYLDRVDPSQAAIARQNYGCLTPWQNEPGEYGRAVLTGHDSCEAEAVEQLQALLDRRLKYIRQDGESFFDAAQNARIVCAAEQYYRIMYRGSAESWNLRDRHMFVTLRRVLKNRGTEAKAIVWAHNSHVGNAAATSMGWEGEFNIGELCRTAYGDDLVAIGFGTDRGSVAAAPAWDAPMQVMKVLPARPDSYEHLFRLAGHTRSLTGWQSPADRDLRDALATPRLERAIGVVYRPDTELLSHYFRAVLSEQFDAYVWFEESEAVTPIGSMESIGPADMYPFGI